MYLFGANGHAKVIIDMVFRNEMSIRGIFDDNPDIVKIAGLPVLGPVPEDFMWDGNLVVAIGNNAIRRRIVERYHQPSVYVVDPDASVAQSVSIGEGTVVMRGCNIQTHTEIGMHSIINTGACIDHDCHISDYVHISPNATLAGNISVGAGTWIGSGAVIIQGIRIGKGATIGAGSVVIRDVEDGATVVGNPARVVPR